MKKTQLVVLAAGMGSRFGGLKQMEPFGENGEAILDFSVHDAVEAGFSEVVFIIKKEIEKEFKELIGKRIEKKISVRYAYQELSKLPDGYSVPEGRIKPWGTAHALLCAEDEIDSPFVIINSDDYYGKEAFKILKKHIDESDEFAMAAYRVENTLSETGMVTRGVCRLDGGYLSDINEDHNVGKGSYPDGTPVSMNMWALDQSIFPVLKEYFNDFLFESGNDLKSEFLLPLAIGRGIGENRWRVKVYQTPDKWYGVTYKDDAPAVKNALRCLQKMGLYE